MPFEVERDGNVARMGESEGIGLHELPRTGKAVTDDDDRGARAIVATIDRRRRRPRVQGRYRQPGSRALEVPGPGDAHRQTGQRGEHSPVKNAQLASREKPVAR